MKKTNNIKRRNNYILLAVMTFMVSLMLVGCSSEATTETVKSEPEAVVKEEAPKVEEVVTKVPEEAAVAEEPIVEETIVEELTEELYIPEGIDMESTLPGYVWLATFNGIIDEPKIAIYNDENNKKIIVEEGQEVEFCKGDTFAIYIPKDTGKVKMPDINTFCAGSANFIEMYEVSREVWASGTATPKTVIEFNGEERTLTCVLKFTE